ncbi:MAG: ABC transporter permease subunit, partial [Rhodobacteraceae bacterium]|nr:ABC transporter permease subunit [Paracoccaceae bacterium]
RLAFEAVDPGLEPAASTLGAGRAMIFITIALPLALPGLIAGIILGFAKALGEVGATITFVSNIPGETRTLSLAVYSFLQSPSGDEAAIRLILISLAISLSAILASEWIARRNLEKRTGRR